jgi:hypothetical protein
MGMTDTPAADPATRAIAQSPWLLPAALAVLAAVCAVPVLIYGERAFFESKVSPDAISESVNLSKPDHIAYSLGGIIGAIVCAVMAASIYASAAGLDRDSAHTWARKNLLAAGTAVGGLVMLFGITLVIVWFGSIGKWLDQGDAKEAHRVLIPIVVVLVGAMILFASSLSARAEERSNQALRRFIYGSNLALTTLLLVFALVAGNIFLALRVPNTLDTTETGFYTLAPDTIAYLKALDQPVTLYSTITDSSDRQSADVKNLLESLQDANPARVQVRPLSLVADKALIDKFKSKYPQYDIAGSPWVLLATGDDESRSAFISIQDFFTSEQSPQGRRGTLNFVGESKVMREVLFLAENKTKAIVYVLQGHGELSIMPPEPDRPVRPGRTANALKQLLEKNYVDVKPWLPDLKDPTVPDDATAVVILDPRTTLPLETVKAIQIYMTAPHKSGRKGKLILATSPFANVDGKGVAETGLEGLLGDYGITLGNGYLLTRPLQSLGYTDVIAVPFPSALDAGNPVAATLNQPAIFSEGRAIEPRPRPEGGDPSVVVEPIAVSYPSDRVSWIDTDPPVDPARQLQAMANNPELLQKMRISNRSRIVAAACSLEKTPRVVVFGSASCFADPVRGSEQARPDLLAASLDWLRDRPQLATINKPYTNYTIPKTATLNKLFWLPVGLVLTSIAVAGLGVWAVRRR